MAVFALLASPQLGHAASENAPPASASSSKAIAAPLQAVVHGPYVEMRIGVGYGVVSADIGTTSPDFPTLSASASESLGWATLVDAAAGLEISDMFAVQLVGGMNAFGSRRNDRVRAVGLAYIGAGPRINLPTSERFGFVVSPSLAYASAGDGVLGEGNKTSLAFLVSLGFEYFVHVRHVSVGLDLTGTLPFSPARLMIGLAPHIRYTF
jgi:hypothetical protein